MKVTENRLDTLIDNLNTLICEDDRKRRLSTVWQILIFLRG